MSRDGGNMRLNPPDISARFEPVGIAVSAIITTAIALMLAAAWRSIYSLARSGRCPAAQG